MTEAQSSISEELEKLYDLPDTCKYKFPLLHALLAAKANVDSLYNAMMNDEPLIVWNLDTRTPGIKVDLPIGGQLLNLSDLTSTSTLLHELSHTIGVPHPPDSASGDLLISSTGSTSFFDSLGNTGDAKFAIKSVVYAFVRIFGSDCCK